MAFLSTRDHEKAKRRQENIAAGNLALHEIQSMYNDFLTFRGGIYNNLDQTDKLRPDMPMWARLRPQLLTFNKFEIDVKKLAFLFEAPETSAVMDSVRYAEVYYKDIVEVHQKTSELADEILGELAKNYLQEDDAAVAMLGEHKVESMIAMLVSVTWRARDGEQIFLDAFRHLETALKKNLTDGGKIPPLVALKEPKDHLKKENLPALPAPVSALIALHDAQRTRNHQIVPTEPLADG